jgi:SAM-dependent methyltransferase
MDQEWTRNRENLNFIKAQYLSAFAEFGYDKRSLFWPRGRQEVRFSQHLSLLDDFQNSNSRSLRIVDYGCGFSDLFEYITLNDFPNIEYVGVDIVDSFLDVCRNRFPNNLYMTRDDFYNDHLFVSDFTFVIGTFNMRYISNFEDNYAFILNEIELLLEKTSVCLSLDFMTDDVDYMQLNSFHVSPERITSDIINLLAPRKIETSSGTIPYEYLVRVWK